MCKPSRPWRCSCRRSRKNKSWRLAICWLPSFLALLLSLLIPHQGIYQSTALLQRPSHHSRPHRRCHTCMSKRETVNVGPTSLVASQTNDDGNAAAVALTVQHIHDVMDQVALVDLSKNISIPSFKWSRVKGWQHQSTFHNNKRRCTIPFVFALEATATMTDDKHETTPPLVLLIPFTMTYSTWAGRVLFWDREACLGDINHETLSCTLLESTILSILSEVARRLDCARVTWKVQNDSMPSWYRQQAPPADTRKEPSLSYPAPDIDDEELTLYLDHQAIIAFLGRGKVPEKETKAIVSPSYHADWEEAKQGRRPWVERTVTLSLEKLENLDNNAFHLRLAASQDAEDVRRLVQGLADFVKEPDAVVVTADDYRREGFLETSEMPLFYSLLIEKRDPQNSTTVVCGVAVIYIGYSVKDGTFLYLEDLFLEEACRKQGVGTHTLKALAALSLDLHCSKFYWAALDWNKPALEFYLKIGAKIKDGTRVAMYSGDSLAAMSALLYTQ